MTRCKIRRLEDDSLYNKLSKSHFLLFILVESAHSESLTFKLKLDSVSYMSFQFTEAATLIQIMAWELLQYIFIGFAVH